MTTEKRKKPRCGRGQSCGYSCIDPRDVCTDKVDQAIANAMLAAVQKYLPKAGVDAGKANFEELESKFELYWNEPWKADKGFIKEDLGNGMSLERLVFRSDKGKGDDELIVTIGRTADGREFVLSDGLIKEYTAQKQGGIWREAVDAAIRRRIESTGGSEQAKPAEPAQPVEQYPGIAKFKVEKELGEGAFGRTELTDRGTVVKTLGKLDDFLELPVDYESMLKAEYDGLKKMHELGIGPEPLGLNIANRQIEMSLAKGISLDDAYGKYDEDFTDAAMEATAKQLVKLHKAGWSHNDIHIGNAMVDETGKVTLIDAGFAKKVGDATTVLLDDSEVSIAKSGYHDLKYLGLSKETSGIFKDVYESLTNNGALDDFAMQIGNLYKVRLADREEVARQAHVKLHEEYLKVLDKLGY